MAPMASNPGCDFDGNRHPLELIPFFRRFRPSPARDLIYTLIWSAVLGTLFLLIASGTSGKVPTWHACGIYLFVAVCVGYATHAGFVAGKRLGIEDWTRKRGYVPRTVYFTGVPLIGVIVGFWLASRFIDIGFDHWISSPSWIVAIASTSVVISAILASIFFWREREARAQARYEQERVRAERVEREAVLANLRALQAQIEPHFLFNTLANVASLMDSDPPHAKRMLESFIRFLRASLAATRTDTTTLGAEGELIAAYLDVLRVRMGGRLAYTIDIPAELAAFSIPPMLLQPVVENAIRHGLEPKLEGGAVAFGAHRDGADLVIEIGDSGVGFAPTTHGGVGLTNLRDRLRGLYGERAALAVADRPAGGALVTIRIPA